MPPDRTWPRRGAVIGAALVLVLAAAGYLIEHSFRPASPPVAAPGCQAGTGLQAISLDTSQAGIAATIAGVAARHRLPRQAVTIAYAAALQESQLQNLDYGDRDSVGIFQQRPSQGWGTTREIENPVYATTRFFDALVRVPGYAAMPVDAAAQAVQHSAEGAAYEQWATVAAQLAGYFTGSSPHGVSCWYTPPAKADLADAVRSLTQTFGPAGREAVVARITTDRSAKQDGSVAVLHAQRDAAWAVAGWLVANAQAYGIGEVRYAGYEWQAADGSMGWQRDTVKSDPPRGSIVAG
ncbi:MAG TPA: hypothetical protein VHO07_29935 [Streptosporangiaceae bacterium]|nr:hypothetical protein [Streptosporangiaceae bacterium]